MSRDVPARFGGNMELKLTTKRALEFEARTGQDLIEFVKAVGETGRITVKAILDLFEACGEGYTVEVFDAWEASFTEKAEAIMNAVKEYIGGNGAKK